MKVVPAMMWARRIEFEVVGTPAPQGSKRPVGRSKAGRAIMVESSKGLAPWRSAVASAARDIAGHDDVAAPMLGPLRLSVTFRFPMPKSRPASIRAAGRCRKVSAPDLDKLVRAVGDALKEGGLIGDDAQICELGDVTKVEVWGSWTGAVIVVEELP